MNIRYDLIPPQGIEEVSKVLTKKLEKFNINQWKCWYNLIINLNQSHVQCDTVYSKL